MSADPTVPLMTDLTVRVTEKGDYVGLEMMCADGQIRTIAVPSILIAKLTAGLLWAAEDCARRGGPAELPDAAIGHLQSSAPAVSRVDVVGTAAPVLDFDVGGAHVCLRLDREGTKSLAIALARHLEAGRGSLVD